MPGSLSWSGGSSPSSARPEPPRRRTPPPSAATRSRIRSKSSSPTTTNRAPTSTEIAPSASTQTVRSSPPASRTPIGSAGRRRPGERERRQAKRGDDARAEEPADAPALCADGLNVREGIEVGHREPEVPHRPDDLAVLDEERPVARHARDDRLLRVDRVRVVEARHEEPAIEP